MFKRSKNLGGRLMVHEYQGGGFRLARGLVYVNFVSVEDLCFRMTFVEIDAVDENGEPIDLLILKDGLSCVSYTYDQHDVICDFVNGVA